MATNMLCVCARAMVKGDIEPQKQMKEDQESEENTTKETTDRSDVQRRLNNSSSDNIETIWPKKIEKNAYTKIPKAIVRARAQLRIYTNEHTHTHTRARPRSRSRQRYQISYQNKMKNKTKQRKKATTTTKSYRAAQSTKRVTN